MCRAVYQLAFTNGTQQPLDGFMIQFNKNSFGLAPSTQTLAVGTIAPGQTGRTSLGLTQTPAMAAPTFSPMLQASSHTVLGRQSRCMAVDEDAGSEHHRPWPDWAHELRP